ncbi:MAG: MarR family transcriptional regulator, organic hydroperoxide resistance regulator [Mycobacterium sp.]|jgi:hypothetical protein|nr:MarR family transcriptional regulator, organic hydroperoxide resistance regulator [Mycobacterium sp.]
MHACAESYFGPLARRLDAVLSRYPPEIVQQIQDFIAELHTTMTSHLDEADFHGPESSLAFAVAPVRRPRRQLGHRWRR